MMKSSFDFQPFSPKQLKILSWWRGGSPYASYDGIIADGAIRSGKTVSMSLSFVRWVMESFRGMNFAICGKTIGSLRRNVIAPLKQMLPGLCCVCTDKRAENLLVIQYGGNVNYFYLFGGKDESSQDLIQGVTLAGAFFDEVALMPESFVNQATARCSVEGAKWWFNCNPEGPFHWFKIGWIDRREERRLYYEHFAMTDNLTLSPATLAKYRAMYAGVFARRFILGEWAVTEGLVYPMFDSNRTFDALPAAQYRYFISIDYGTLNPFSAGLWAVDSFTRRAYRIKEYYYDGRMRKAQLTDEEYYAEIEKLAGNLPVEYLVIDPSAASFIAAVRRHGRFSVRKAVNDVLDGIRVVSSLLKAGMVLIHSCCSDSIREFGLYSWDEQSHTDKVLKENDHAMDDIRYFCYTILAREFKWYNWG